MANDDQEVWHLPKPLQISNPKVAAAAAEMAKDLSARAVSPFARLSPQEFARVRASARIPHLAQALQQVDQEIKQNRGVVYGRKLQEARRALMGRLAESLATAGDYSLAAEVAPDLEKAREYAAVFQAMVLDDSHKCRCAPGKSYVKAYIYSQKHQRPMPLIACAGCGVMNVTTLPSELADQQSHRAKARQMVAGLTPTDAAATLRAAGHTSGRLLPK